jgi:hypothetical protein
LGRLDTSLVFRTNRVNTLQVQLKLVVEIIDIRIFCHGNIFPRDWPTRVHHRKHRSELPAAQGYVVDYPFGVSYAPPRDDGPNVMKCLYQSLWDLITSHCKSLEINEVQYINEHWWEWQINKHGVTIGSYSYTALIW